MRCLPSGAAVVRDTGPVANGVTGILTASTQGIATPEVARRAWPQWLALGVAMIAVAVTSVLWDAAGARLLLGALGLFLVVRGRCSCAGRGPVPSGGHSPPARGLGTGAAGHRRGRRRRPGSSGVLAARVLLVAVPVLLLVAAVGLLGRGGVARPGGQALLVWTVLVTGLLVATGVAQGWARAADVATVVAALAVAVLAVPLLVAGLRVGRRKPCPPPRRVPVRGLRLGYGARWWLGGGLTRGRCAGVGDLASIRSGAMVGV